MKKLIIALGLIGACTTAFANTYQVHNKPNDKAKVISTINDHNSNQYIPFFQKGHWIKVADTKTGNVGWINAKNIKPNTTRLHEKEQKTQFIERSFNSISVVVNKDGKTATVTKKWLGKDGKIHVKTKQVPVKDIKNVKFEA